MYICLLSLTVIKLQAPPQDTWNGELLGYVVTWREAVGNPNVNNENSTQALTASGWGATHALLVALKTHTHYDVKVQAYNTVGAGPPSITITAATLEGGKLKFINYVYSVLSPYLKFTFH